MTPTIRRRTLSLARSASAAALAVAIACNATATRVAAQPIDVGSQKQLFIDHKFIDSKENIDLVVNPPKKRPGAFLRSDKPWEAFRLIYYSVAEDQGMYKMWYQAFDNDQWSGGVPRMCYAVSQDGLHWEKPNLGLVEYNGSKENNILLEPSKLGYVFIDPHGKPEQRYKMLSGIGTTRIRTSPDGIQWHHSADPIFRFHPRLDTDDLGPVGDAQSLMVDTARRRYVAFLRGNGPRLMSVSDDFETWTAPRPFLEPLHVPIRLR